MANAAIVAAGSPAGGISVFNAGPSATDVIIDMNGYFAPPSGGLDFYPVAPCRLVDTRGAATGFNGIAPFSGPSIPDGGTLTIPVQSITETIRRGVRSTYVSLWPAGSAQPFVATLNDPEGLIVANAAIVPAGSPSGGINVFNPGPSTTDAIIDMNDFAP